MSNAFYAPVRKHQLTAQAIAHICVLNNLDSIVDSVRKRYPNFGRGKSAHGENDFYGLTELLRQLPSDILRRPLGELLPLGDMSSFDPPTPPTPPPTILSIPDPLPLADAVHPSVWVVDIGEIPLLTAVATAWRSAEQRQADNAQRMAAKAITFEDCHLPAWCDTTIKARQASAAEAFGITEPGENVPSPSVRRYKANRGEPVLFGHKPAFGNVPYTKAG